MVIDVIDGLPNGSYTFEVYGDATGTTPTATLFDSNGGANFKASFIITPEPGMVILFGLALLFFRKIWT